MNLNSIISNLRNRIETICFIISFFVWLVYLLLIKIGYYSYASSFILFAGYLSSTAPVFILLFSMIGDIIKGAKPKPNMRKIEKFGSEYRIPCAYCDYGTIYIDLSKDNVDTELECDRCKRNYHFRLEKNGKIVLIDEHGFECNKSKKINGIFVGFLKIVVIIMVLSIMFRYLYAMFIIHYGLMEIEEFLFLRAQESLINLLLYLIFCFVSWLILDYFLKPRRIREISPSKL